MLIIQIYVPAIKTEPRFHYVNHFTNGAVDLVYKIFVYFQYQRLRTCRGDGHV